MDDSDQWRSRAKKLTAKKATEKKPEAVKKRPAQKRPAQPPTKAASSETPSARPTDQSPTKKEPAQGKPKQRTPESAVPEQWQPLDAATAFASAAEPDSSDGQAAQLADTTQVGTATSDDDQADDTPPRRSRKRISWIELLGGTLVLGLLVAAFVLSKRQPKPIASQPTAADKPTAAAESVASSPSGEERAESEAESPAAANRKREDAIEIANRVMDDAGDGSFALEMAPATIDSDPRRNRGPSSSSKPSLPPEEPAAATSNSATPSARIKDPPTFPPAPNPNSIVPVPREWIERAPSRAPRKELNLPQRTPAFVSFSRLYRDAFEIHQAYLQQKKSAPESEDTHTMLQECVKQFQQCLGRPVTELTAEQRFQITFTLASLYYDAGRLYEAAAYAWYVTRHAAEDSPLTTAAATLLFATLQEAHQTQYGDATRTGELLQMEKLCDLFGDRGIKLPQIDTMRFSLAQLYQQDGYPLHAAKQFLKVRQSSPLFQKARLAAGRAFWAEAAFRKEQKIDRQQEAIVSSAAKYLRQAIEGTDDPNDVTQSLLAGKYELAQIASLRQDPQQVSDLLDGSSGVLKQVNSGTKMPADFITAVHELLFQAYSQMGDLDAMQSELDQLAKRYGRSGKEKILRLRTKLANDFIQEFSPNQPVDAELVRQFEAVMQAVIAPKRKPTSDLLLWAAQSWSELATRAEDKSVAERCSQFADDLIVKASNQPGIDSKTRMTLRIKRIELAEQQGATDFALQQLAGILKQTPTAIELQLRAARLLSTRAKEIGDRKSLEQAIGGRPEDSIWGWAKLTTTLARLHLDSEDKARSLERLLESGYGLNEIRLLQARSTDTESERSRLLAQADKNLGQLLTTYATTPSDWTKKLRSLQSETQR